MTSSRDGIEVVKTCRMVGPSSWQWDKQNEMLMGRLPVLVMKLVSGITEEEGGRWVARVPPWFPEVLCSPLAAMCGLGSTWRV